MMSVMPVMNIFFEAVILTPNVAEVGVKRVGAGMTLLLPARAIGALLSLPLILATLPQ